MVRIKFLWMVVVAVVALSPGMAFGDATFNLKFDLGKINNAESKPEDFHFIIKAKMITGGKEDAHLSFLNFDADGNYSGVKPDTGENSLKSYYNIKDFKKAYEKDKTSITFLNIPNCVSGRAYIVYGAPIKFPDGGEPDHNGDAKGTIYDKMEFTLDINDKLYINTTAVDFVSIPMTVSDGKTTKGITSSWSDLAQKFSAGFSEQGVSPAWKKHCMVDVKSGDKTILTRIVSPGKTTTFPKDYLENYIDLVWDYYAKTPDKIIKVDCSEVAEFVPELGENTIFTGKMLSKDGNTYWSFTNTDAKADKPNPKPIVVDMLDAKDTKRGKPTSDEVFGANASGPLFGENQTVKSVIGKTLYTALAAGLMPLEHPKGKDGKFESITLSGKFFEANSAKAYQANPLAVPTDDNKPWTTLYARILHSQKYAIYAYAYDDVFGWDSTIVVDCAKTTPTVTCAVGDMKDRVMPASGSHEIELKEDFVLAGMSDDFKTKNPHVKGFRLDILYQGSYYQWVAGKGINVGNKTIREPKVTTPMKVRYGYVMDDAESTFKYAEGDSINLDNLGSSTIKTPDRIDGGKRIALPPPNPPGK